MATKNKKVLEGPKKLSEVKEWVAAHGNDPKAFEALASGPRRLQAQMRACVRAIVTLGGPRALDTLATYRGDDDEGIFGHDGMEEVIAAWGKFDRREFARRLFGTSMALGERGGLRTIEGIDAREGLWSLSLEAADGCSLAPLTLCPDLISLEISALGDLDVAPIARLPQLDRLSLRGEGVQNLDPLRDCQARRLHVHVGASATMEFLRGLPRADRVRITTSRQALRDDEIQLLRELVARGVSLCAYGHEPWSVALRELGAVLTECVGYRAVGPKDLRSDLESDSFL